jgi:hypothetical protein
MQSTVNAIWPGPFPQGGRKIRHWSLSADVIRKELGAEGLLKPLCLGFGFEGLDFVTDALVSLATRPFGLGGYWLSRGRQAAEPEAELCSGEASTAVFVAFL